MAMTSLQLPPTLLLSPRDGCASRRPRMAAVSCKYNQSGNFQGTKLGNHISRRDTLSFMSCAVLAVAFLVASPAEARTSRLENKKKAMEKLEKLREKALGSKEKNGGTGKDMPPANLLIPPPVVEASL
ncbi:hypothetical protein ACP70R_037940 [Stipagrostis hirtigluma subsp. patula]